MDELAGDKCNGPEVRISLLSKGFISLYFFLFSQGCKLHWPVEEPLSLSVRLLCVFQSSSSRSLSLNLSAKHKRTISKVTFGQKRKDCSFRLASFSFGSVRLRGGPHKAIESRTIALPASAQQKGPPPLSQTIPRGPNHSSSLSSGQGPVRRRRRPPPISGHQSTGLTSFVFIRLELDPLKLCPPNRELKMQLQLCSEGEN